MRLCTFREYAGQAAGVMINGRIVALDDLNEAWGQDFGPDLGTLIQRGQVEDLARFNDEPPRHVTSGWRPEQLTYTAPYRNPPKIWCVGLNYGARVADLPEGAPDEPASCMRPATTIQDPGAPVALPKDVGTVYAEGEIALVMGKRLKDAASAEEARDAVLGFTIALDFTAKELVQKNPRWLTRAKSADGFLPLGPWIVTKDEWEPQPSTHVATLLNGKAAKEATAADMIVSHYDLVAHYSRVFTWEPGDILLTGSPGSVPLAAGDRVAGEVEGLGKLENPVESA